MKVYCENCQYFRRRQGGYLNQCVYYVRTDTFRHPETSVYFQEDAGEKNANNDCSMYLRKGKRVKKGLPIPERWWRLWQWR